MDLGGRQITERPLIPAGKLEVNNGGAGQTKRSLYRRVAISKPEAVVRQLKGDEYKRDLLENIKDGRSLWNEGGFYDLCRGPHIPNTGFIKVSSAGQFAALTGRVMTE